MKFYSRYWYDPLPNLLLKSTHSVEEFVPCVVDMGSNAKRVLKLKCSVGAVQLLIFAPLCLVPPLHLLAHWIHILKFYLPHIEAHETS